RCERARSGRPVAGPVMVCDSNDLRSQPGAQREWGLNWPWREAPQAPLVSLPVRGDALRFLFGSEDIALFELRPDAIEEPFAVRRTWGRGQMTVHRRRGRGSHQARLNQDLPRAGAVAAGHAARFQVLRIAEGKLTTPSLILPREREARLEPHAVRKVHLDIRRGGLEGKLGLCGGNWIASVRTRCRVQQPAGGNADGERREGGRRREGRRLQQ